MLALCASVTAQSLCRKVCLTWRSEPLECRDEQVAWDDDDPASPLASSPQGAGSPTAAAAAAEPAAAERGAAAGAASPEEPDSPAGGVSHGSCQYNVPGTTNIWVLTQAELDSLGCSVHSRGLRLTAGSQMTIAPNLHERPPSGYWTAWSSCNLQAGRRLAAAAAAAATCQHRRECRCKFYLLAASFPALFACGISLPPEPLRRPDGLLLYKLLPANKQVQVPGHPSDSEEPATASDSSSGADPWTVVTSPSRRTAPAMPAAVPENTSEVAEPQPAAGGGPGGAGGNAEAAGEPVAAAEPAAVKSSGSGPDGGAAASPAKVPQASPVEAAAPAAAMEEAAGPAHESDGEADDLDDIEVAVDGNDEDVDEDWGYTAP